MCEEGRSREETEKNAYLVEGNRAGDTTVIEEVPQAADVLLCVCNIVAARCTACDAR